VRRGDDDRRGAVAGAPDLWAAATPGRRQSQGGMVVRWPDGDARALLASQRERGVTVAGYATCGPASLGGSSTSGVGRTRCLWCGGGWQEPAQWRYRRCLCLIRMIGDGLNAPGNPWAAPWAHSEKGMVTRLALNGSEGLRASCGARWSDLVAWGWAQKCSQASLRLEGRSPSGSDGSSRVNQLIHLRLHWKTAVPPRWRLNTGCKMGLRNYGTQGGAG
jgi:hypothetical protein